MMQSRTSRSLPAILAGVFCVFGTPCAIAQADGVCHITNVDFFLEQCPTKDPAIDEILSDFRITHDGVDITEIDCEEPVSTLSSEKYTHELILLQQLRTIYYLDKGREGHLPWTDGTLYDWLKNQVGGFNISNTAQFSSCCGVWPNGDRFVTLKAHSEIVQTDPQFRQWNFIASGIGLVMHEARHVDGFRHLRCCAAGNDTGSLACDLQYDESNLSPYGIQYWLERAFLDGTLYTGYGCLGEERISAITSRILDQANRRERSFCESPPPRINADIGAPCLDCQPADSILANDDGPFVLDEGGALAGTPNILDNDIDPQADILVPSIVELPMRASFFELAATGSFDYVHDGSETLSDSFTYRVSDGINESEIATVSLTITPVNDRPEISLNGDVAIEVVGGDVFSDPGATAQDEEDGDISARIVVGGDSVNTDVEATYNLTYDVADSEGLSAAQVTRTVNVVIDDPPVITLNGAAELTLVVGDTYTEQGANAHDPEDGDVSNNIVIGGDPVNAAAIGTYVVTYDATDAAGNQAAQLTRTVVVNAAPFVPLPVQIAGGGGGYLGIREAISLLLLRLFSKMARRPKNRGQCELIDTPVIVAPR